MASSFILSTTNGSVASGGRHHQQQQQRLGNLGVLRHNYIQEDEVRPQQDSDEDTEDASETDMVKHEEYTGLKEQMYQEKLGNLKKQLQMLKDGVHPEFNRRVRKLDQGYRERLRLNEVSYKYELECVEREYVSEKRASARDFEEKKIELRESLLIDLEDKKKNIESERLTMEFTGDSMEVKPVTTRKLRRRPNDPAPLPEKRRKTSPAQLNYLLDECLVMDDLKLINRGYTSLIPGKAMPVKKPIADAIHPATAAVVVTATDGGSLHLGDVRIEDGRLHYDKRWFQRGQPVYVESKETGRFGGVISALGTNEVWIRKTADHSRIRIYLVQLQKGKFIIRRRAI